MRHCLTLADSRLSTPLNLSAVSIHCRLEDSIKEARRTMETEGRVGEAGAVTVGGTPADVGLTSTGSRPREAAGRGEYAAVWCWQRHYGGGREARMRWERCRGAGGQDGQVGVGWKAQDGFHRCFWK